jgi:hypothetical protein
MEIVYQHQYRPGVIHLCPGTDDAKRLSRTIIRRWELKMIMGHKDIIITKLLINVNISLFASKCLLEYLQNDPSSSYGTTGYRYHNRVFAATATGTILNYGTGYWTFF